ncbi:MAG TPA: C4-dicarboxylate ABC transporter [bacterium]|nr:C4-dicarboxylate ABC transporter [bacterium]
MQQENSVSKLKYFPVTAFSVVMGLSGLAILLYRAYHLGWLPLWAYLAAAFTALVVFAMFVFIYGLKAIWYFEEVKKEYNHKVKVNFFSAISISFLLVSVAFYGYLPFVSAGLWYAGVIAHLLLTFHTVVFWIRSEFEVHDINPAWFIPVVGNLIIPVVGVDLAPTWVNIYFFITGMFFWITLFAIVLYRLVFHKQLAEKFIPTMFIFIAPPAVIFISYFRMFLNVDVFSMSMLSLALFFLGLLVFLVKDFFRIRFYLSWWAYTFPVSALGIAMMIAYQATGFSVFKYIAVFVLVLTAAIVAAVMAFTVKNVVLGKICVMED